MDRRAEMQTEASRRSPRLAVRAVAAAPPGARPRRPLRPSRTSPRIPIRRPPPSRLRTRRRRPTRFPTPRRSRSRRPTRFPTRPSRPIRRPSRSTTEPDPGTTTTTAPGAAAPKLDPIEALQPRPEFGTLSSHQRALVEQLQRATDAYVLRRFGWVELARQVQAAKDLVDQTGAVEQMAVTNEILGLAEAGTSGDDGKASGRRKTKVKVKATTRGRRDRRRARRRATDHVVPRSKTRSTRSVR